MAQFLLLLLILASVSEARAIRKLGQHPAEFINSIVAPCSSPSQAPPTAKELSGLDQQGEVGQGQQVHLMEKKHRSIDKSVAGGGVILGGLVTTFLVAVFRYIRATGRKNEDSGLKNMDSNSENAESNNIL